MYFLTLFLEIMNNDFDLSNFTASHNENQKFDHAFPLMNEPTFEDEEENEGKVQKMNQSGLEMYYGEGVTARNSYEKSRSKETTIIRMEMEI